MVVIGVQVSLRKINAECVICNLYARGQNSWKINIIISLSTLFAHENLVSRDRFAHLLPHQPSSIIFHTQVECSAYSTDSSADAPILYSVLPLLVTLRLDGFGAFYGGKKTLNIENQVFYFWQSRPTGTQRPRHGG